MANNTNSLRSDWAAYKIQQAEKWGHADMVVAQGLADTAEALALVNARASEIGNQKLADIAKTVADINGQRAAQGNRCYRKVTATQRYALATALLEKYGSPRAIVKAGWSMTDIEIDSAEVFDMLAIVQKCMRGDGEKIYLLGFGNTEAQARMAAYEYCNHGHNQYDDEFLGGHLLTVAERLSALQRADHWVDEFDEAGSLIGSRYTDARDELMYAMGALMINDAGELDYTPRVKSLRASPPVPPMPLNEWDDAEAYDYV